MQLTEPEAPPLRLPTPREHLFRGMHYLDEVTVLGIELELIGSSPDVYAYPVLTQDAFLYLGRAIKELNEAMSWAHVGDEGDVIRLTRLPAHTLWELRRQLDAARGAGDIDEFLQRMSDLFRDNDSALTRLRSGVTAAATDYLYETGHHNDKEH